MNPRVSRPRPRTHLATAVRLPATAGKTRATSGFSLTFLNLSVTVAAAFGLGSNKGEVRDRRLSADESARSSWKRHGRAGRRVWPAVSTPVAHERPDGMTPRIDLMIGRARPSRPDSVRCRVGLRV